MGENYNDMTEAAFRHIKGQRHDFMNYLQVLYGYLQLGRKEAATGYIMKVSNRMLLEGRLGSFESKRFYLAISEFVAACYRHNIEVELCCDESYISCEINTENIDDALETFSSSADAFGDYFEKHQVPSPMVFIYIYEDNEHKYFIAGTQKQQLESIYKEAWKSFIINTDKASVCYTDSSMLLKIELS